MRVMTLLGPAACVGAMALLLLQAPAFGEVVNGVEVVQGGTYAPGATGQVSLQPPSDAFTQVTAESSDANVVTVDRTSTDRVNFTFGKVGIALITLTWTTGGGQKFRQFIIVNTGFLQVTNVIQRIYGEGGRAGYSGVVYKDPSRGPGTYIDTYDRGAEFKGFGAAIVTIDPVSALKPYDSPYPQRSDRSLGGEVRGNDNTGGGMGGGTTPH